MSVMTPNAEYLARQTVHQEFNGSPAMMAVIDKQCRAFASLGRVTRRKIMQRIAAYQRGEATKRCSMYGVQIPSICWVA